MAAYHEAAGVRSLVLAMSHLELSKWPALPPTLRHHVLHSRRKSHERSSRLFVGGCQQIATNAIVPFNTGLWQHSSQAFSVWFGGSRHTVKSRHFVPTLPVPDSSNNPELNCVLPFHNEFDFASLDGLEGLKVDNIKPQKIASSSPMATVRSFSLSGPQKRCLPPAEGAR